MGHTHFCQFPLTLEAHSQKPYEQRNILRLYQALVLLILLLPHTNLMRLLSNEGEASKRDTAYGPVRHQNIHPFASTDCVNCAQGDVQLPFACFGSKSAITCMCILLRQIPMSSIAWLMGKKQAHHCEQHGGLFQTKICNGKNGIKSFSPANQRISSVGCGMVWNCMYYANSQEKEGFQNTK